MSNVFGRYELLNRLARGGSGEVFLARRGGKLVVVKRLLPHRATDEAARTQFLEEARVVSQVRHPNVVQVLELGELDGQAFLAMEYVEGASLHDHLFGDAGPLSFVRALKIAAQLAGALHAIHSTRDASGKTLGAMHGDLTPRNVLITANGSVKLIDFGKGRTLEYSAPESADDQYSLGVIIWELLAGRGLFHGEDDAQTVALVDEGKVPALENPEVDAIVRRMLSRDARKRYPSLAQVREAVLDELEASNSAVSAPLVLRRERPITPFIGRARELAGLIELIDRGARAITIAGPSGAGKRRLALALLEQLERSKRTIEISTTDESPELIRDDVTLFVLTPMSGADQRALSLNRSGQGESVAADGLALTLELLASRSTTAPGDLRSAFETSWAALKVTERQLLLALQRRSSALSLEEAEALAPEALDLLETLRGLALVQVIELADGALRFGLHEAIRALVRSKQA